MNLGGAMVWSLETEDFKGICGEAYPLLKSINYVLRNGIPLSKPNFPVITTTKPTFTTPNTSNPQTPATGLGLCEFEGYLRDPNDCSVFYLCVKIENTFIQYPFKCPFGTVFNPSIEVCDWPNNVVCK